MRGARCEGTDPECAALGTIDGCWDEETSEGNPNNGDAISKLSEYQGVKVGGTHMRLDPERKEVFVDVENKTQDVTGFLTMATGSDRFFNGIVVENGQYVFDGKSVYDPECVGYPCAGYSSDGVPAGITRPSREYLESDPTWLASAFYDTSGIYDGNFANLWGANSIKEDADHQFHWTVQLSERDEDTGETDGVWTSWFDKTSLNPDADSDTEDLFNPFDLLSPGAGVEENDSIDGKVVGSHLEDYYETATLHEFGHAVGMSVGSRHRMRSCDAASVKDEIKWARDCHPQEGNSVMRLGFVAGGKAKTYSAIDIKQMLFKGRRQ